MLKSIGCILAGLLLCHGITLGQPDNLKQIIPPSPGAAAITKYGLYPVSMFTGIPNISIPIYTVKAGNVTLPISLDYHASGIRVDDYAGWVGLGWIMNAGGAITRTVMGVPDDDITRGIFAKPPYREGNVPGTFAGDDFLAHVAGQDLDAEPDVFSFNFCGKAGKFVFKPNKTALLVGYDNLKIEWQSNGNFKITDAEGNVYFFEDKVVSSTYTDAGTAKYWPVTGWYLTRVIPLNSTDTIHLTYDWVASNGALRSYEELYTLGYKPFPDCVGSSDPSCLYGIYRNISEKSTSTNYLNTEYRYVKTITSKAGLVQFVAHYSSLDYSGRLLDSVAVFNGNGAVVKRFNLMHDYFYSTTGSNPFAYINDQYRLKLTALKELGAGNKDSALIHSFVYDETNPLPPRKNYGVDDWGYYNGHSENTTLLTLDPNGHQYTYPAMGATLTSGIVPGIRTPDGTFMKAGMLKRIIYPTGGYTDFEFEANQYETQTPVISQIGGGLRVKSISDYSDSGILATKETYAYGENEVGYGKMSFFPYLFTKKTYEQQYDGYGGVCGDIGKALNILSYPFYHGSDFGGSKIAYPVVTKYEVGGTKTNGKTIYRYDFEMDDLEEAAYPKPQSLVDLSWKSGHLIAEKTYKQLTSGDYQLLKEDSSIYTTYYVDTAYGLVVGFNAVVSPLVYCMESEYNSGGCIFCTAGYYGCYYYEYPIFSAAKKLTQKIEKVYQDDLSQAPLANVTNYSYNMQTFFPASSQRTNSKGDTIKTVYKYPHDFVALPPYDSMVYARHIWSPVIEQSTFNGNNFLRSAKTNYNYWNNGTWGVNAATSLVVPQSVDIKTLGNAAETRLKLNKYDTDGNLIEQQKAGDVLKSYIWDYNSIYPIAEATNAAQTDIAYTSFEADGSGGWTIGSGSWDSTHAITGRRSHVLNSDISRTGLSSSKTYIVSYWSGNSSNAYTIPGTLSGSPVKGKTITINGTSWTFYVHKITGQTSVAINGSGHIDELRLYPVEAQMTTYTYQPLVGMTSACDVGNRITYYEYDGLQRLKRVRDQDYNIIKSIDYQYQGNSGCGANCYILTMQTFAGTNTLGYPVGVFDVRGKLLGNATNPSQYVALWNNDTADSRIGTLSTGGDSLHFNLTLNSGQTLPSGVTGCRYYQVDLTWNIFDGVRNNNAAYVDFGDSIGMRLPTSPTTIAATIPARTTYAVINDGEALAHVPYYIHTYPDTTLKTLTFYHNDDALHDHLDNVNNPATSLTKLTHLRGNLPQNLWLFGGSCYQSASMNSIDSIYNWYSLHNITYFELLSGDRINPCKNLAYAQDFMKNNKGLQQLITEIGTYANGYRDTTFKLSRLKSDWNTYFTQLKTLAINDDHWNREDLSALHQLSFFVLIATTQNHQDDPNSPLVPIPQNVIDSIFIQIAAGAGQTINNGIISLVTGGTTPSAASQSAIQSLLSKGWIIYINGTAITNP